MNIGLCFGAVSSDLALYREIRSMITFLSVSCVFGGIPTMKIIRSMPCIFVQKTTHESPSLLHRSQINHQISDFKKKRRSRIKWYIWENPVAVAQVFEWERKKENWSCDNSFVLHFNQLLIFVVDYSFLHSNFMFIRF